MKPVTALCMLLLLLGVGTAVAQQVVPPADRNVTPPDITPGPKVNGPLERTRRRHRRR